MVELIASLDASGLALLFLGLLVIFLLALYPFRLYAIDRRLKIILEEIRRLSSEVRRKGEPDQTKPGRPVVSIASADWVDKFGDSTQKTKRGIEEKSSKIS